MPSGHKIFAIIIVVLAALVVLKIQSSANPPPVRAFIKYFAAKDDCVNFDGYLRVINKHGSEKLRNSLASASQGFISENQKDYKFRDAKRTAFNPDHLQIDHIEKNLYKAVIIYSNHARLDVRGRAVMIDENGLKTIIPNSNVFGSVIINYTDSNQKSETRNQKPETRDQKL